MEYRARVRLLPTMGTSDEMEGQTVVVIDVLRATTTICAAVAHRAGSVIPTPDIPQAFSLKSSCSNVLLGGERGGVIIDGFDLGNSPREYVPERVAERTIVLCTTNGTVAMEHCRGAEAIYIGAFVNLTRVVEALQSAPRLTLVCAGTDQCVSSEDSLYAGAVLDGLKEHGLSIEEMDDSAQLAWAQWQALKNSAADAQQPDRTGDPHVATETIVAALLRSRGGRKLANISYHEDIRFCAQVDLFDVLPALDTDAWMIRDVSAVTQ